MNRNAEIQKIEWNDLARLPPSTHCTFYHRCPLWLPCAWRNILWRTLPLTEPERNTTICWRSVLRGSLSINVIPASITYIISVPNLTFMILFDYGHLASLYLHVTYIVAVKDEIVLFLRRLKNEHIYLWLLLWNSSKHRRLNFDTFPVRRPIISLPRPGPKPEHQRRPEYCDAYNF